jgi:hypothetical protein
VYIVDDEWHDADTLARRGLNENLTIDAIDGDFVFATRLPYLPRAGRGDRKVIRLLSAQFSDRPNRQQGLSLKTYPANSSCSIDYMTSRRR